MIEHKFNNGCDVILFNLSYLLDRFDHNDHVFAAQCNWWLLGITQFTETSMVYQQYRIFTSHYINNLVVTPLDQPLKPSVSESYISKLQFELDNSHLHWEFDQDHYPGSMKWEIGEAQCILLVDQTT